MPVISGSLADLSGVAIPAGMKPEIWFHLPRPMRAGSRIVPRKSVKAALSGTSWSATLEQTKHRLFDDGRPAHMLVEVRWRDTTDALQGTDLLAFRLDIPATAVPFADIVPPPGDIPVLYTQDIDPLEQWPSVIVPRSLWLKPSTGQIFEWVEA